MPLAQAQTQPAPQEDTGQELVNSTDPTLPASESEAIQDAEDLKGVIEGTSNRVRLRLDTWGFYDLEADEAFAKSKTTVPPSELRFSLKDQKFELSFRTKKILTSRFKVKSISRFGDFLVFIEEGSYLSSIPAQDQNRVSNERGIQYVSFIDLKQYSGMFGQTQSTPPIFTLPVAAPAKIESFSSNGTDLILKSVTGESVRLPQLILETWSRKIYGLALDVTARLLEPRTYATLGGVVEELEKYFKEAIDQAAMNDLPEQVAAAQSIRSQLVEKIKHHRFNLDDLKNDAGIKNGIIETQNSMVAQRKISTRLRLIWQRLSFPSPLESAMTLKESLAFAAYGITLPKAERNAILRESGLQILNSKFSKIALKLGVPVAAAAMLGTAYPEEAAKFYYEALGLGSTVIHGVIGFTRNLFELGLDSTVKTLKGLKPHNFYQAYLSDGKAAKFATGVTAIFTTGAAVIATPLVVVNTWLLARDLSKNGSFTVDGFIERQQNQLAKYLKVQAETQRKLSERFGAQSSTEFTAQDTEEVNQILNQISVRDRNILAQTLQRAKTSAVEFRTEFIEKVRTWRIFRKKTYDTPGNSFVESESDRITEEESLTNQDAETIARSRIHSFGTALQSFVASYPSITEGFTSLVRGWNGFTIFRRVFWSPSLWVVQTLYPNFSNVALGDGANRELTLPTRANGGLDPTPVALKRVFQFLTFSSNLDLIRAWEAKIIPVEKAILGVAMEEGFSALIEQVRSQNGELNQIFQNVTSLSDPRFQKLGLKQKLFFLRFVESVTARSLQKLLTEISKKSVESGLADPEAGELSINELKKKTLGLVDEINVDDATAKRLVQEVVEDGLALKDAKKAVTGFKPDQIIDRLRLNSFGIVDPKNTPTFKRIQVVLEMMKKPESMPRAVRATLSSLIMAKFIGIGMTLVALSGMQGGILQPFYPDQMFGPNSYFYMGRYPFVSGLLVGLGTSMFSNAWIKLQQDASHSDHFGEVPAGEDAKKGYLSWFYKQSFKNPNNTFWGNQKTYWSIIWGNMKPAFVLMLASNLIGLGRFDLDGYFAGYVLAFGVLNSGFNMMLEQGSEFASYYPLKDFPERLRGHPSVQEYLARKQQVYRIYFSIWEKTFVDLQEMIIGNFERMGSALATATYRNEAFSRMLFGGFTPTELLYSGAEALKAKTGRIPFAGPVIAGIANACERLVTRDYTSWDKVKPPADALRSGAGSPPPSEP